MKYLAVLRIVRQQLGQQIGPRIAVAPDPPPATFAEHRAEGVVLGLAEALIHVPVDEEPLSRRARGVAELPWPLKRIARRAEDGCDEPSREVVEIDELPDGLHARRAERLQLPPEILEFAGVEADRVAPVGLEELVRVEVLGEHVDALELAVEVEPRRPCFGNDSAGRFRDVVHQWIEEMPADAPGTHSHVVVNDETANRVSVCALECDARRQFLRAVRPSKEQTEPLARRRQAAAAAMDAHTGARRVTSAGRLRRTIPSPDAPSRARAASC